MATHYKVRHHEAIWETTTLDVVVPDDVPTDEHRDWIEEHFADLLLDALGRGEDLVSQGDHVGLDDEFEIEEKNEA